AVLMQEDSRYARSITAALKNSNYFDFVAAARSPAELDRLLRTGDAQFAVTVPGDFSRRVARGDRAQVLVEADATDPSAARGGGARALARPPRPAGAPRPEGRVAGAGPPKRAFGGGRPPPLQPRGHHLVQHRPGPAGRDPDADAGDDDGAQRHPRDRARDD